VYEDEHTLAFLDLYPNAPGHTLVIPKEHYENVYSTPSEAWARLMLTTQKLAIAIKQGLDADGVNITMNNEEAAGQEINHAHVHIIPRHRNDGLIFGKKRTYDRGEAAPIAEKIIKALNE